MEVGRKATDLYLLDLLVDGGGGGRAVDRGAVLAVDLDERVAVVLQVVGGEPVQERARVRRGKQS